MCQRLRLLSTLDLVNAGTQSILHVMTLGKMLEYVKLSVESFYVLRFINIGRINRVLRNRFVSASVNACISVTRRIQTIFNVTDIFSYLSHKPKAQANQQHPTEGRKL